MDLNELAQSINANHELAMLHARKSLDAMIKAGESLTLAKEMVKHGEWQEWLTQNFNGCARTARRYIAIYRDPDGARKRITDTVSVLAGECPAFIASSPGQMLIPGTEDAEVRRQQRYRTDNRTRLVNAIKVIERTSSKFDVDDDLIADLESLVKLLMSQRKLSGVA